MTTTLTDRRPPAAVRTLLEALGAGDLDAAVAAVPDGALSALPGSDGPETAPRVIARDQRELRDALGPAFGERRAEVLSCVTTGDDNCLVEGRLVDDQRLAAETFLAGLQLRDGRIARLLVYTCPLVEPSRSWDGGSANDAPGDARAIIDRYFEHLDASEFEAAAACFSPDALYSHPPYGPGHPRAEFRGRDELLAGFRRRGPKPDRDHHIDLSPQRGTECFLEGYTIDEPRGGTFISSLSLDPDGLIQRYLAVYCEPIVPRI
jgi:ketosteroid isomerase-like protein